VEVTVLACVLASTRDSHWASSSLLSRYRGWRYSRNTNLQHVFAKNAISFLRFRFNPLHQRAKRLHTAARQPLDRTLTEHKLDSSFQSSDHCASHDVLWQRGNYFSVLISPVTCPYTFLKWLFYLQRFTQYLASSNSTFQLSNFLDKSGVQGDHFVHNR